MSSHSYSVHGTSPRIIPLKLEVQHQGCFLKNSYLNTGACEYCYQAYLSGNTNSIYTSNCGFVSIGSQKWSHFYFGRTYPVCSHCGKRSSDLMK